MQFKSQKFLNSLFLPLILIFCISNIVTAKNLPADPFSMNQKNYALYHSQAHLKGPGFSGMVTVSHINGIKEKLFEGDILVSDQEQVLNTTKGVVTEDKNDNRWPNQTLYYKLMGTSTSTNRTVQLATKYISDRTNVKFVRLNANDTSKHHVRVYDNYSGLTSLCASHVGRTNLRAGYQNLYLVGGCSLASTIHEFLHALGVWHEHSRKDRDQYVKIHWDRIHESTKHNFQIQTNSVSVGPYDFDSIMHYPYWAFNINNDGSTKTISSKVPGKKVPFWNDEMSKGDIASINYMYPDSNSKPEPETDTVRSKEEIAKIMAPIFSLLLGG